MTGSGADFPFMAKVVRSLGQHGRAVARQVVDLELEILEDLQERVDHFHGGVDPLGRIHRDVVVHDVIREEGRAARSGSRVLAAAQKSRTTCSALGMALLFAGGRRRPRYRSVRA